MFIVGKKGLGSGNKTLSYLKSGARKDTYIEIGKKQFFIGGRSSLQSFTFKMNKKGGDSSKVIFGKDEVFARSGESVNFFVNGELRYVGFVESVANNGRNISVQPYWNKLGYTYVSGSVQAESTLRIKDLLASLAPFLNAVGIIYLDSEITVPDSLFVTITLSGMSITEILDTVSENLPKGYIWGVNSDRVFYYKTFPEKMQYEITYLDEAFSSSEITRDTSEIFSEYLITMKEYVAGEEVVRTLGVVGAGKLTINGVEYFYPPTTFTDLVGKKTGRFDIPVQMGVKEALDLGYDKILKQYEPIVCKISDVDFNKWNPKALDCLRIVQFPQVGYIARVDLTRIINNISGAALRDGAFATMGDSFGRGGNEISSSTLNLAINDLWLEVCDVCEQITQLGIEYQASIPVTHFVIKDSHGNSIDAFAQGGSIKIDIAGFDKRTLVVSMVDTDRQFVYRRIISEFTKGCEFSTLNVREIEYKYENGALIGNVVLANIGTALVGYIFNERMKMQKIQQIISNSNIGE